MKNSIKMQYRKFKNTNEGEEGKTSTCRFTRKDDDLKVVYGTMQIIPFLKTKELERVRKVIAEIYEDRK